MSWFGTGVGMSWDELVPTVGESGWVLVDVGSWGVDVIVCGSVFGLGWVNKGMHFDGGAEDVE